MIDYVIFGVALSVGLPIALLALLRVGAVAYTISSYRRVGRRYGLARPPAKAFADSSFKMSLAIAEREDLQAEWIRAFRASEPILREESNLSEREQLDNAGMVFYGTWWVILAMWADRPLDRKLARVVAKTLVHFTPMPVKKWARRAAAARRSAAPKERHVLDRGYYALSYSTLAPRIERRAERTLVEVGELMSIGQP